MKNEPAGLAIERRQAEAKRAMPRRQVFAPGAAAASSSDAFDQSINQLIN
jgi:hypothetical protein